MELATLWIGLSIIAAAIANQKGRSALNYFLLALFLSPIIGLGAAILAQTNQQIEEQKARAGESNHLKKCPYCAEIIQLDAIKCRYCKTDLPQHQPHKVQQITPAQAGTTPPTAQQIANWITRKPNPTATGKT